MVELLMIGVLAYFALKKKPAQEVKAPAVQPVAVQPVLPVAVQPVVSAKPVSEKREVSGSGVSPNLIVPLSIQAVQTVLGSIGISLGPVASAVSSGIETGVLTGFSAAQGGSPSPQSIMQAALFSPLSFAGMALGEIIGTMFEDDSPLSKAQQIVLGQMGEIAARRVSALRQEGYNDFQIFQFCMLGNVIALQGATFGQTSPETGPISIIWEDYLVAIFTLDEWAKVEPAFRPGRGYVDPPSLNGFTKWDDVPYPFTPGEWINVEMKYSNPAFKDFNLNAWRIWNDVSLVLDPTPLQANPELLAGLKEQEKYLPALHEAMMRDPSFTWGLIGG